jgi:flagellar motor switch protein FliG
MLDRYKKGGGILELVKLIEESGEPKRSQLLNMIRTEDPQFAAQVEGKLFSYESLRTQPEGTLAEVIAGTPPKFVALSLVGETPEFVALCEKCLGKSFNDYKMEKESIASAPPAPQLIESARRKLVATARKLESEGRIKLPGSDVGAPAGAAGGGAKIPGSDSPAMTGNAGADSGCPPVESFQLEAPPPGLSGERLETFLKQTLGF